MAYRSFRQFLDALEQAGELKRVTIPVDTELLVAEWADREMKSPGGGKALLFEQPTVDGKKSEFPVAINTMGSRRRMAMALKVSDVEDVAREIQLILKAKPPTDLREGWNLLKQGIHLLHARPKSVRDAPCQEVAHEIEPGDGFSLRDLPILKCWPKDGGRFVTLPNVHTRDPETGARNVGINGAIAVGAYIGLVSVWGAPVSGASMNPARSLGPELIAWNLTNYWIYLVGPIIGAMIAVGFEYILKGKATKAGADAAQGVLDEDPEGL